MNNLSYLDNTQASSVESGSGKIKANSITELARLQYDADSPASGLRYDRADNGFQTGMATMISTDREWDEQLNRDVSLILNRMRWLTDHIHQIERVSLVFLVIIVHVVLYKPQPVPTPNSTATVNTSTVFIPIMSATISARRSPAS